MGRTLGLIAGSGRFPFAVAQAVREHGFEVAIVAVEANAAPAIEAEATAGCLWIPLGQLDRMIDFLRQSGVQELILAGGIHKAVGIHDLAQIQPDSHALALLAKIQQRGDDALLRVLAQELESEGLSVVASTRYLASDLAGSGRLAGPEVDRSVRTDLEFGLGVVRALGAYDVGQAVVVKNGAVLAVEAVEGTDAALRRGAELGGPGAVLVKAAKPNQDLRFDVPTIGPSTLEQAHAGGIAAIGLEQGRTLILERAQTFADADRHEIALIGLGSDVS